MNSTDARPAGTSPASPAALAAAVASARRRLLDGLDVEIEARALGLPVAAFERFAAALDAVGEAAQAAELPPAESDA